MTLRQFVDRARALLPLQATMLRPHFGMGSNLFAMGKSTIKTLNWHENLSLVKSGNGLTTRRKHRRFGFCFAVE
jgi:hypothetical protein